MTQRGHSRAIATMRPIGRAMALIAAFALAALRPAPAVAAPAITRTRAAKPRHEAPQPQAASAGHAKALSTPRAKHAAGKPSATLAASHKSTALPAPRGHLQRRSRPAQQSMPAPRVATQVVAKGRSRHAPLQAGPAPGKGHRWQSEPPQAAPIPRTQDPAGRAIAEHRATDPQHPKPQQPVLSEPTANGGELSMDDFLRVAGAASADTPMLGPANPRSTPTAQSPVLQRIDGFGAEGVNLRQPHAAADDTLEISAAPDSMIASAAASDPRVRALVHPSHEEMADEISTPMVLPGLYRNGRLVVPAPMKGSHDILVHQNTMADDEGLERVRDEDDLQRLRATRQLIDFPESASLRVNPELGYDRRCARVWTVKFAQDTARAFYARFHAPLQVNSAVRTVAYQLRLQRTNGNAAGIRGETSSPHLTGQAIDFGKRGMSVEQIAWMRAYLGPLMAAGTVDVEEEFQQACFHISVYRSYLPQMPPARRIQVATLSRSTTAN